MILAIDPGYTTGIALGENVCISPNATTFDVTLARELLWEDRFNFLTFFRNLPPLKAIVIEEFRLFKHRATDQINSEFPSVRVIGIVEAYAMQFGYLDKIIYQRPADIHIGGKAALSIPPEHKAMLAFSNHATDAYLHLRYYIKTHRKELTQCNVLHTVMVQEV